MKLSSHPKAIYLCLFLMLYLAMGCDNIINPPDEETRNFLMGAGATARDGDYSGQGFADMIEIFKGRSTGELAGVYLLWRESLNTSGQIPQVVLVFNELGRNNFTPVVNLNFFDAGSGKAELTTPNNNLNNWTNAEARRLFKQVAVQIAQLAPAYLALGNEINLYYISHPEDFSNFVSLYREAYDTVKAVSPNTRIFTVFQLEGMKGLIRLSYGQSVVSWNLLEMFRDKLDLVGFTTYPSLVSTMQQPAGVPVQYYAEIATEVAKRLGSVQIAFTEIGWDSDSLSFGTEREQADFVPRFFKLTRDLDKTFVIWGLLHDVKVSGADGWLDHAGLRRFNGDIKPAWNEWLKFVHMSID